jgi:hypothetical protein
MTLFRFSVADLDLMDGLRYELATVRLVPVITDNSSHTFISNSQCPSLSPELDWFAPFELAEDTTIKPGQLNLGIQLRPVGYENLRLLKNMQSQNDGNETNEINCLYRIELVVKITDGLFTIKLPLELNVHYGPNSGHTTLTQPPLLQTLEIDSLTPEPGHLLNLDLALVDFIGSQKAELSTQSIPTSFQLLNHEDLFAVDNELTSLRLRTANLTKTNSDYELYFRLNSSLISGEIVRVLIKFKLIVARPEFIYPFEIKHTREVLPGFDQFHLNKTYLLGDLLESTERPFMRIGAITPGHQHDNTTFRLGFSIASCSIRGLFRVNEFNGQLSLNPAFDKNSLITENTNEDTLIVDVRVKVENVIVAEQLITDKFESVSMLSIRFTLLNRIDGSPIDRDVYFKQTFFVFRIIESIQGNKFLIFTFLKNYNHESPFPK